MYVRQIDPEPEPSPNILERWVQTKDEERRRKAREKRLRDLEMIQERARKAKEFLNDNGNGADEGSDEEGGEDLDFEEDERFIKMDTSHMWDLVLSFLNDVQDMKNASMACETFERNLAKKRHLTLLTEALKVLQARGYLNYGWDAEHRKAIRTLREVSKGYRRVIDQLYFDSEFCEPEWYNTFRGSRLATYLAQRHILESVKDVDRAISASPSPSVARIIHVEYKGDRSTEKEFYSKLWIFLKKHGAHVWSFKLTETELEEDEPMHENYVYLWKTLTHMPNLKALTLKMINFPVTDQEERTFRMKLMELPFPQLESLKHFEYTSFPWGNGEEPLCEEAIGRNPTIRSMYLGDFCDIPKRIFQTLRNVRLESFKIWFDHYNYDLNQLNRLHQFGWPLKMLKLCTTPNRGTYFSLGCLFRIMNRFRDTLEHLEVKFNLLNIEPNQDGTRIDIDLPHLKTLNLARFFRIPDPRGEFRPFIYRVRV